MLHELSISNSFAHTEELEDLHAAWQPTIDDIQSHRILMDEQPTAWVNECERISQQAALCAGGRREL